MKKNDLSRRKRPRRRRIPRKAIFIKPAPGKNYADVLKEVQTSVKPNDHGVSAKAIRQTKTGVVLIELKATKEDRESFGTALQGLLETILVFVTLSQRKD